MQYNLHPDKLLLEPSKIMWMRSVTFRNMVMNKYAPFIPNSWNNTDAIGINQTKCIDVDFAHDELFASVYLLPS